MRHYYRQKEQKQAIKALHVHVENIFFLNLTSVKIHEARIKCSVLSLYIAWSDIHITKYSGGHKLL